MLPPHALKQKEFTHVMRGYSAAEVDEFFQFVFAKYNELYKEYDAVEHQLKTALAQIEAYREDEENIRSALVEAKRAAKKIVEDANGRAEIIEKATRDNCDAIMSEFRGDLKKTRAELLLLRRSVKSFKEELFMAYSSHIDFIEKIAPELDAMMEEDGSDVEIVKRVVNGIREDIEGGTAAEAAQSEGASTAPTDVSASADTNPSGELQTAEEMLFAPEDQALEVETEPDDNSVPFDVFDEVGNSTMPQGDVPLPEEEVLPAEDDYLDETPVDELLPDDSSAQVSVEELLEELPEEPAEESVAEPAVLPDEQEPAAEEESAIPSVEEEFPLMQEDGSVEMDFQQDDDFFAMPEAEAAEDDFHSMQPDGISGETEKRGHSMKDSILSLNKMLEELPDFDDMDSRK